MTNIYYELKSKQYITGLFIWGLAGIFFLYEFFIRAFMGSVADPLQQSLLLSPAQFSLIASAYYLAYSPMQIPIGILMDRYGTRVLISCGCLICGIGALCFGHSHDFHQAWTSRFLMGLGSSVGFISILTIASNWFPRRYFGFFAGMTEILGMIGPILSGAPLAYWLLKTQNDWRHIMIVVGIIGFFLTVILAIFIRNKPKTQSIRRSNEKTSESIFGKLKMLLKMKQVRLIVLYSIFIYGGVPLLGESWGVPFLQARGFGLTEATGIIASLWLGLGIGSPIVGLLSDTIRRRKSVLIACALAGFIFSFSFIFISTEKAILYSIILFLIGFATGGQTLSFAILAENAPENIRGTAMGLNNMAVMLGGMLSQIFAGWILNSYWHSQNQAISSLSITGYQFAIGLSALFFAIAIFFGFTLKETYAENQV